MIHQSYDPEWIKSNSKWYQKSQNGYYHTEYIDLDFSHLADASDAEQLTGALTHT